MRIEVHTSDATQLWKKILKAINDGKIKTWSIIKDSNNEYLTHTPNQWFKKAVLQHSILTTPIRLKLEINWYSDQEPTEYVKGLYVGRFTEELLEHFRNDFSKLETYA